MSRLDEIKARADAATEGPWVRDMHSPDMSGRSGWYIRGPRKLGLRSMVLNSRMLPGDAEFIEHAREDVPWLIERVQELNGAICWDTTCLNCASLLDSNYDQYVRAEKAEAEVERLTAERDALAAQVARVKALAGQWERMATTAINPDSREWLQACSETLRECLSGWQKMHAAIASSEADTGEQEAGHRCEPYYSRSQCGQCGWQEQWCATCSRQMCGCATETTDQEDQA